jgi:hypothetical protein
MRRLKWLILLAVAVCLTGETATLAVPKGSSGRIAFERHTSTGSDIYTVENPRRQPAPGVQQLASASQGAWASGSR